MKWEVEIKRIETYVMNVEADSEEEAKEKGHEAIESDEGKSKYHNESDCEESAYEI
tara:strand:- start:2318 stop:2485 length:168 start_codon:yes stop_codon:yes gene_type:complete